MVRAEGPFTDLFCVPPKTDRSTPRGTFTPIWEPLLHTIILLFCILLTTEVPLWSSPVLLFIFSRSFICSSWICFPVMSLNTGGSALSFTATSFNCFSSIILITSARWSVPRFSPVSLSNKRRRWWIFRPTLLTVWRARGSCFTLVFLGLPSNGSSVWESKKNFTMQHNHYSQSSVDSTHISMFSFYGTPNYVIE